MRTDRTRLVGAVCAALILGTVGDAQTWAAPAAAFQPGGDAPDGAVQRSPFDAASYRSERLAVLVGGAWYELDGISGEGWSLSWDQLRGAAEGAFGREWQRRIAEDLDAVLAAAGVRAGDTLSVRGRPLDGPAGVAVGEVADLRNLPHTREKRAATLAAIRAEEDREQARRLRGIRLDPRLPLEGIAAALRMRHAQGMRLGVDWDAALAAELEPLGDSASALEIIRAAQRLVARAGDGHAGVEEFLPTVSGGFLPFALVWVDGRWRGYLPETRSWVWPADAAEVRIDGVGVDEWVRAAAPYIAAGSEQLVRRRSARLAHSAGFVRELLRVEKDAEAPVEVTWTVGVDGAGAAPMLFRAPLGTRSPRAEVAGPVAHDAETGVGFGWLGAPGGGRIACLRIASMEDGPEFRGAAHAAMRQALVADGLIIDVRGNGGGSRESILAVLPYLMREEALVYNIARPRMAMFDLDDLAGGDSALLANRFLMPVDWDGWTPAERAAVKEALAAFRPSWSPAAGWEDAGFGPWYAAVVSRKRHGPADAEVRGQLPLRVPVAVLVDDGCFSATDIFLGAIERLPNVTLVGTASSGGSARSRSVRVEGPPRLTLRLASIASFRADGRAYDSAGIEPDIEVFPAPGDYEGGGDRVLEAAVRHLAEARGGSR